MREASDADWKGLLGVVSCKALLKVDTSRGQLSEIVEGDAQHHVSCHQQGWVLDIFGQVQELLRLIPCFVVLSLHERHFEQSPQGLEEQWRFSDLPAQR